MKKKHNKCSDCDIEFIEGEEVMEYAEGKFYKCKVCYDKDPTLENYQPCDVYSRTVGYHAPVSRMNKGKAQEFVDRKMFKVEDK